MTFTPLHQRLGLPPGPITDDMLTSAIEQGVAETDGIDWKSEALPVRALPQSDFPKDVAAMANSGGGVIVYGITEDQKVATGRQDVGDLDAERYERALRSAAVTAIHPPIFGLGVTFVGEPGDRAVAVTVPASQDGPHLIYKNDYFAAPIRNDADTVWMRERQIEQMYRARFDEQRHSVEALDALYTEAIAGRPISERAWLIAVARPRIPLTGRERMDRMAATTLFREAQILAGGYATNSVFHPLDTVDVLNPRPGLRRWIAPDTVETPANRWKSAMAAIHFDGSVSLATAVGGAPTGPSTYAVGSTIESGRCERAVGDMMALMRATGENLGVAEYELRIGIAYGQSDALLFEPVGNPSQRYGGPTSAIAHFTPVDATVRNDIDETAYIEQMREVALDVVNQGGIQELHSLIPVPSRGRP